MHKVLIYLYIIHLLSQSQWRCGLRCRSAAAPLLRSWVRIPPGAWMFVCCECCVLSGRGLRDELITRPEESYRLWCVVVCDLETSRMRRPWPALGRSVTKKIHLLKSSTCFEHCPAHLQEVYVVIVYMQPMVSSLSAGDCPMHRLRKSSFLTGAQDSHLQRVTIPEAACIQLRRRPPEDEQGNARNM